MLIQKNKKRLIIPIVILLLVLGAGGVFAYAATTGKSKSDQPAYSGPTEQEKAAGNSQKEAIVDREKALDTPTQTSGGATSATVVVTDASYYPYDGNDVEVRAYIDNVYESGGKCTAVFTQGSQTVSVEGAPFQDSSRTQCGAMNLARSAFPSSGDWSVIVSYASSSAQGSSAAKVVTLP